jgi:hypothetical protein
MTRINRQKDFALTRKVANDPKLLGMDGSSDERRRLATNPKI